MLMIAIGGGSGARGAKVPERVVLGTPSLEFSQCPKVPSFGPSGEGMQEVEPKKLPLNSFVEWTLKKSTKACPQSTKLLIYSLVLGELCIQKPVP